MRETIALSIAQFEDLYSEWDEYKITLVDNNSISIHDQSDGNIAIDMEDANELLTDFKYVLKKNNLMITSLNDDLANIGLYTYGFEDEYESLADKIEELIGVNITNLLITSNSDDEPEVTFEYTSNMTSGEKKQIIKKIDDIISGHLLDKLN